MLNQKSECINKFISRVLLGIFGKIFRQNCILRCIECENYQKMEDLDALLKLIYLRLFMMLFKNNKNFHAQEYTQYRHI